MNPTFSAGWGEADITPDAEVIALAGQYYSRIAQTRHSPLKTVVLALRGGETAGMLISLDTVSVHAAFTTLLRNQVAAALPGLSADHILINATHTHSAPGLKTARNWWKRHPEALTVEAYQAFVANRVVEAARKAWSDCRPAAISPQLANARVGHCRRAVYADGTAEMYGKTERTDFLGMEGNEDSGVDLLFLLDRNGKPQGVIVNVPCPSQVMEATYALSSDYMGTLREKLKGVFGAHFHTLCQISAAGCQSPRDLTRHEAQFWGSEGVEIIASRLCDAIVRAAESIDAAIDRNPAFAYSVTPLSLPRRRASYREAQAARRALDALERESDSETAFADFYAEVLHNEKIDGFLPPFDDKLHPFVLMRNAEAVLKRHADQSERPDYSMRLHTLRIGQCAIVSNPFELFLEYGQRIKARSPAAQTFVVQLSDDSAGYLPSPRAETLGGYGGLIINGQVGADGGAMLVDRTVAAIVDMFA